MRGWCSIESAELDFTRESPQAIRSKIEEHFTIIGFFIEKLTNILRIRGAEFVEIYGFALAPSAAKSRHRIFS